MSYVYACKYAYIFKIIEKKESNIKLNVFVYFIYVNIHKIFLIARYYQNGMKFIN